MRTKLAFCCLRSDNTSSSDSLWSASHNPSAAASTLDRSRGVRIVDTGVRWELRFESDGMIPPSMCNRDAPPCYLTCKNASDCFATAARNTLYRHLLYFRGQSVGRSRIVSDTIRGKSVLQWTGCQVTPGHG